MPLRGHARIAREDSTVAAMIALYCRDHHACDRTLCADCAELASYSRERLDRCPFQEGKTICSKCAVHCYRPEMRERIRTVMRYSGPRMLARHPIMAMQHLVDKRRDTPLHPTRTGEGTQPPRE